VGLHAPSADKLFFQDKMTAATTYPLLQEILGQSARAQWNTKTRHDVIVLDAQGKLVELVLDVQDLATQERMDQLEALVLGKATP